MARPRVLIARAPGTNCDQETAFAFEQAGAEPDVLHINRICESPQTVGNYQIFCLPGGFSYGDDIAAGRIFATQIQHYLTDVLQTFKQDEKLILGICNGFQALLKSGLLLAEEEGDAPPATLTWNDHGRYEDRWVNLQTTESPCVFLRNVDQLYLPIAHAEGKFVARDASTLDKLASQNTLALRYTDATLTTPSNDVLPFPTNPNGSVANVAGICDPTGHVFGLMPHPERYIDPVQHPRWTRGIPSEENNGSVLFRNAVEFFAA